MRYVDELCLMRESKSPIYESHISYPTSQNPRTLRALIPLLLNNLPVAVYDLHHHEGLFFVETIVILR